MQPIVHLMTPHAWAATSDGALRPPSLAQEGFVHCSAPAQVAAVANARFHDEDTLVMIVLDPRELRSDVVWEDSYDAGQRFPHVYGPIDRQAIARIVEYRGGADGSFQTPVLDDLS